MKHVLQLYPVAPEPKPPKKNERTHLYFVTFPRFHRIIIRSSVVGFITFQTTRDNNYNNHNNSIFLVTFSLEYPAKIEPKPFK